MKLEKHSFINVRRSLLLLHLLLLATICGCVSIPTVYYPKGSLPFGTNNVSVGLERGFSLLFAPVKLNGRDVGHFLLDTGSNVNVVDMSLSRGLRRLRQGHISEVGGNLAAWLTKADSLSIGQMKLGKHGIVSMDMGTINEIAGNKAGGILGYPVFGLFPWTIDYAEQEIIFHRPSSFVPPTGAISTPMQIRDRRPCIRASINGTIGWFILDTGATGVTVNEVFINRNAPLSLDKYYVQIHRGAGGREMRPLVKISNLEFCGHTFNRIPCAVAPEGLEIMDSQLAGIIGGLILQHFRLTFDYNKNILYASYNRPERISDMVDRGLDLQARDFVGASALDRAIHNFDVDCARELITAGINFDEPDRSGRTPLISASQYGALEIAHLLIEKGARIEAKDNSGVTALMAASFGGDMEFFDKLIERGADVNARDNNGMGTLMFAAIAGHIEIAKKLIEKGVDTEAATSNGETAMKLAKHYGHDDLVRLLRKAQSKG